MLCPVTLSQWNINIRLYFHLPVAHENLAIYIQIRSYFYTSELAYIQVHFGGYTYNDLNDGFSKMSQKGVL